jgi:inorganic pyrophosphatase
VGSVQSLSAQTCWRGVAPLDFPQPAEFPAVVAAVIEIPTGSFVKYEIDPATGVPVVDRFVSMPVAYPANYGFIAQSLQEDGDPLDILVFTRAPLDPGVVIPARPIGLLKMTDRGELDDKVIAVPADDIDPSYADIESLADLPVLDRERLEAFFRIYKELPQGAQTVTTAGFEDLAAAVGAIETAVTRCRG